MSISHGGEFIITLRGTCSVVAITPERARWVADEHWHPQQQGHLMGNGRCELRIPYSDPRELVMDMLKHGAEVEVISPDPLRDEAILHLRAALVRYRQIKPAPPFASGGRDFRDFLYKHPLLI